MFNIYIILPDFLINNQDIPSSNQFCYLGFFLDGKPTWNPHNLSWYCHLKRISRTVLGRNVHASALLRLMWNCEDPPNSNKIQTFQSNLRRIVSATFRVSDGIRHIDHNIPIISEFVSLLYPSSLLIRADLTLFSCLPSRQPTKPLKRRWPYFLHLSNQVWL